MHIEISPEVLAKVAVLAQRDYKYGAAGLRAELRLVRAAPRLRGAPPAEFSLLKRSTPSRHLLQSPTSAFSKSSS